jgi:hypothetical protein
VELIYKPFSTEKLAEAVRRLLPPETVPPNHGGPDSEE